MKKRKNQYPLPHPVAYHPEEKRKGKKREKKGI